MCTWGKKSLKFLVPLLFVVVLVAIPLPTTQIAGISFSSTVLAETLGDAVSGGFWDIVRTPSLLVAWLLYIVLEILGVLLAVCAAILDFSISLSIIRMSEFVTKIGGINAGWSIIRDLVNIVFVFALLFVGINTILGSWSSSSFNTKLIPKILLAALLINFSMLFTKIVIDTSNILTLELYTAAQKLSQPPRPIPGVEATSPGLTGAIMNSLSLQAFLNGKLTVSTGNSGGGGGGGWGDDDDDDDGGGGDDETNTSSNVSADRHMLVGVIMAIIVVLIAMFVFLAMAFMLLGRMVIFIILIITSPIAFMGELLPQLKSQAGKWWEALWGQAFFAPVFFALLIVVLRIIGDPSFQSFGFGDPNAAASIGVIQSFIGGGISVIIKYFIVIYLLVSSLIIAKSVSGSAGKGVAGLSSTLAGGMALGGTAFLARQTVGRAGAGLANAGWVAKLEKNPYTKRIGQSLSVAGNWSQKASFDTRGIKAAASLGLDAGKAAGEGGLIGRREARSKKMEERAGMYAKNRAILTTQEELEINEKKQRLYNEAPAASPEKAAARSGMLEANKNIPTLKDKLNELKGGGLTGVKVSESRTKLAEAEAELTTKERQSAVTIAKAIAVQEEMIKAMEARLKINKDDEEAQKNFTKLTNNLKKYRAEDVSPQVNAFIDAQKALAAVTKGVSDAVGAEKISIGYEYLDSTSQAMRDTADKILKGKEKPEESLANELKKMLATPPPGTPTAPETPPPAPAPTTPPPAKP